MRKTTTKISDKMIEKIRNLAATTDMTQLQIAEQVGVTNSTVSRYLNIDKPRKEKPKTQERRFLNDLTELNNKNKNVRQLLSSVNVGEIIEIIITRKNKEYIASARVEQISKNCLYAKSDNGKRFSIFDYQLLMEEMKIRKVE